MARSCKCGCGEPVSGRRVFVDKEHQLDWMVGGGASELNRLQPVEAKRRGGKSAGREAAASGRLSVAGAKGAERSREIAKEFRARHPRKRSA